VGVIEPDALQDWRHMTTGLEHVSRRLAPADLSALQRWAPRVRRFSFVLSPSPGRVSHNVLGGRRNTDERLGTPTKSVLPAS
jgi:hypothetical protein